MLSLHKVQIQIFRSLFNKDLNLLEEELVAPIRTFRIKFNSRAGETFDNPLGTEKLIIIFFNIIKLY